MTLFSCYVLRLPIEIRVSANAEHSYVKRWLPTFCSPRSDLRTRVLKVELHVISHSILDLVEGLFHMFLH